MTTYNTGNPLGSVDVRDLYDNAENLDNFSNGPLDEYADRLGVTRQSLQGIRNASQYVDLGPYAAGLEFTSRNQVFSYLGEFYSPGPSITLPYTTTGIGAAEIANFRSVGDAMLRAALADPLDGAELVAFDRFKTYSTGTVGEALGLGTGAARPIRSFGVVGDGVADDTAAMAAVAAYSGSVVGSADLVILTDSLTFTGALQLDLQGGSIKMRTAFQRHTVNASGVSFRRCVFDGAGLNVNVAFFRIPTTYSFWSFEQCTFKDITGIAGSANQYGIYADLDNAVFRISDTWFTNISNVSNGTPTSAFCGAMLLSATTTGALDGRLESLTMNNIFCTGIAGNINNSDADGIRVFGPVATVNSNLQMLGINCVDVQKSGIKTSGVSGLIVDGVNIYNDRSDIGMIAGVRFQAADDSIIKNINLKGRMTRGVNLRAKNVIVDGVMFQPIDTARDVMSSGLIQLQSDDTHKTRHVKVCNVVATNVTQAFDLDTAGTTVPSVFEFIEFHHWDVTMVPTVSAGTASRVQKATHIILDHVYLWDPQAALINSIAFTDVTNFKAHYCRFEARREMFTWSPGCNGIEFDGCSFLRQDIAATENLRMLLLRDTSAGALDRVTVRDATFSCPAYSSVGNQQCVFIAATNAVVDGVTIYVRDAGANVSPPSGWIGGIGSGMKISDVKVSSQSALTNGSGGYAVDISTSLTGSVVTDIMNNSGPGVRASAGGNNNLIDSVAGKVTAVSNAGTGNTVGSAHVLP
jgi:hypothetical protein